MLLALNLIMAMTAFFAAHWAAHRTRSLTFGHVDVTEAQWSMIAIHVASAIGGPAFWARNIFEALPLDVGVVVCLFSAATLAYSSLANFAVALGLKTTPLETSGIRIPRAPLALWPVLAYVINLTGALLCMTSGVFASSPIQAMLVIGLAFGKTSTHMIFHKLSTRDAPILDLSTFSPLVLVLLHSSAAFQSVIDLEVGAWTLVVLMVIDVVVFHSLATSDLAMARHSNVFSLRYPPGELMDMGFYVCGGNLAEMQKAWKEFSSDEERVRITYPSC